MDEHDDDPSVRYGHVLRFAAEAVWALQPSKLAVIRELLHLRASGARLTPEEIRARIGAAAPATRSATGGSVGVIQVLGVLTPRANLMTETSGATSIEKLQQRFRQALADPGISSIVLDVDSPGGAVDLVAEFADEIAAARGRKPIVAVANTLAASAAYWIASQVDELVVSPSGEVGSIGVYGMHWDESEALAKAGLKPTVISAGKFKAEATPFAPLGAEARGAFQGRVNDFYALFTEAVARGRGASVATVRNGFGEGRVVGAKQAVRLGMADRVGTIDAAISRLLSGRWQPPQHSAATSEHRHDDLRRKWLQLHGGSSASADLELRRRRLRLHEAAAR